MTTMNPVYRKRLLVHRVGIILSVAAMTIGLLALAWILYTLLVNGFGALSLQLFTADTPAPNSTGGGLRNAILGSMMMVGLSTAISTPIGILAGVYLAEYGDSNWFAQVTRFVTDVMLSAPSIVIGLFVYAIYVANVGHFSGYAGTLALSLIAVPVWCAPPTTCCAWYRTTCSKPPSPSAHRAGKWPPWCACAPSRLA